MSVRCDGCRYYHPAYSNEGECRRYPPKGQYDLSRVRVPPDYWCGEHVAIEQMTAEKFSTNVIRRLSIRPDGRVVETHSNITSTPTGGPESV